MELNKRELDRYITKSDEDLIMGNDDLTWEDGPPTKLRIWWIPQAPGKAFHVYVKDLGQAKLINDTLARYDQFQYENRIKPDYSNAGGLQMWDDDSNGEGNPGWVDWYDEETGESFEEWMEAQDEAS